MLRFKSHFSFSLLLISIPFCIFADDVYDTKELVVTASRVPVPSYTVGSSMTIISGEQLKKQQTMFVLDILRNVPGLSIAKSGGIGTFTEVRARGAESNHTLVLIDGIEGNTEAVFGSAFSFSSLLAKDVERIEVLRGPQSALWGSDAIGAVINIITKKKKKGLAFNSGAEFGSLGTENLYAGLSAGDGAKYINFNAESLHADGINIARTGSENDAYYNRTYNLKAGIALFKNLELDFILRHINDDVDTDPQFGQLVTDRDGDKTNTKQTYINGKASITTFDDIWSHEFNYELVKSSANSFSPGFNFHTNGDRIKFGYLSDVKIKTPSFFNTSHGLSLLLEYEDDTANGTFVGGRTDAGFITKTVATEYRLNLFDDLHISTSVRHDDQEFFKDSTTYRVSGTYNYRKTGTRLHSGYGTAIKNPTINELYGNFPNFTGNENLKPESSKGWDFGIEQTFLNHFLVTDITFFQNTIEDLIQGQNTTAINLAGKNKIKGVEFSLTSSPLDNFDINANYTFTNTEGADGLELVRRPKHIAGININYSFLSDKANLNLNVNYHGRRQDFDFATFPASRVSLGSYTLVNLATSYTYNKYLSFFGRIENLLNDDYEEIFSYQTPGATAYAGINFSLNP